MPRNRLAPWLLVPGVAFFALLALPWPGAAAREASAPEPAPVANVAPAPAATAPLGPMEFDRIRGAWTAAAGGSSAVLTIDWQLQDRLERFLASRRVPAAVVVLLEPRTGRVLALAEHSRAPAARGLSLRALAPAASVFKIVTTAALLQQGLPADQEVCFHGGRHRLAPKLLRDDPRRDRKCYSLGAALGHSANVVFAKLAGRGLSAPALRAEADRFLFNTEIPFAWPVDVSRAEIPEDRFRLAETAAGFGPVRLSPLHAALIAAAVANGGTLVAPRVVEAVDGVAPPAVAPRRILEPGVAAALAEMMRTTVTEGTARKVFRADRASRSSPLRGVTVAGKTGSLSDRAPFRDYSWFVGFAGRGDEPEIAIATVVVNERVWNVRATQVAREALAAYYAGERALPRVRTASR